MKYPDMDWGTMEAVVNKLGGMDGVRRFLSGEPAVNPMAKNKLLELVTTISIPAAESFNANSFFKENVSDKATTKISYLGQNFRTKFLKKTEVNLPAAELKIYNLKVASLDIDILAEIEESKRVTSLAHLAKLLEDQGHAKRGVLLINGYANIFYVEDVNRILWAVYACWSGDGWNLGAYSVGRPSGWDAGGQVLAR